MNKTLLVCLSLLLVFVSRHSYADGNRYLVEMIVFSQNLPTGEKFEQTDSKIQWPSALTELSAYQQTEIKSLKDGASALFRDPAYQALARFAWIQTAGPGNALLPVHIQSPDATLDGFVQIRNSQPLQLTVDLEQQSPNADSSGKRFLYRINEKRSLNLNDILYFDHPKIGIVMRISGA